MKRNNKSGKNSKNGKLSLEKVGIRELKAEIAQSVGGTRDGGFHTDLATC